MSDFEDMTGSSTPKLTEGAGDDWRAGYEAEKSDEEQDDIYGPG